MPLYQYRCPKCAAGAEVLILGFTNQPEFCVHDGEEMQRLPSVPVIRGETVAKS